MAGLSELQKTMNIRGKPHRLAWVNPKEEELLSVLGGSGEKVNGFPAYIGVGDEEGIAEDYGPGGSMGSDIEDIDDAEDQWETEEDVETALDAAAAIDWDDSASEGDSDWYAGTSDLDFYDKQRNLDLLAGLAGYDEGKLGKKLGFEPYKDPTHAVDLVSTMERKGFSNLQDLVGENVPENYLPDFLEEWKNRPDRLTDPTTGEPLGYYDEKGDIAYKSVPAYFDAMTTGEHPTKHGGLWEMINTTFPWQKDLGQPWQAITKSLPTPIAALGQFFADIVGFKKEEPVEKKPKEALIQDKTSFVQPSIAQLKTQPGLTSYQPITGVAGYRDEVVTPAIEDSFIAPGINIEDIRSGRAGYTDELLSTAAEQYAKQIDAPEDLDKIPVTISELKDIKSYGPIDKEVIAQYKKNKAAEMEREKREANRIEEINNRINLRGGMATKVKDTLNELTKSARDREDKIIENERRLSGKDVLEKVKNTFEISPAQAGPPKAVMNIENIPYLGQVRIDARKNPYITDPKYANKPFDLVKDLEFGSKYLNDPRYTNKNKDGTVISYNSYWDGVVNKDKKGKIIGDKRGTLTVGSLNMNSNLLDRLNKAGFKISKKDLKAGIAIPAHLVDRFEKARYREAKAATEKLFGDLGINNFIKQDFTNLVYNMGMPKAKSFKEAIKNFKAGNIVQGYKEILDSKYGRGPHKNRAKTIHDRGLSQYMDILRIMDFKGGGQIDRGLGSLIYRQEGGDLKTILPPELEPEPEPEEEPITGTPMEQYFKRQATEPYWSIPPNRYTSELVGGLLGDENIKDTWRRLGWSPIQPPVTDPVPLPQPITGPVPLPQPGPIMPFGGTDPDGNKIKDYTDDEDSDPDPYSYYRKLPPPEPKEPGPKVSWDAEERELDDYKDLNYTDAMKKYERDEKLWYDEYGRDFGTIGNPGKGYQGTQGPDGWPTGRPRRPPMKYEDYETIEFPDDDDDDDDDYVPILPPPRRRRRKKKRPELVLD